MSNRSTGNGGSAAPKGLKRMGGVVLGGNLSTRILG